MVDRFDRAGWALFANDPAVRAWVDHVRPHAQAALGDPALAQWWQCEGTWFVGVDALANDARGTLGASGPLRGAPVEFIAALYGPLPELHPAQVSVVFPGYPRPRQGEGDAAFRYRLNRDAAHVDGVLPEGAGRRRFLREPHAWILGLPLNESAPEAAPLVVWEGSHRIMGQAFRAAFAGAGPDADLTEIYHDARREVFDTCTRREIPTRPGDAVLLHRHLLHGVAPWRAPDAPQGRMIAYFRPQLESIADWF